MQMQVMMEDVDVAAAQAFLTRVAVGHTEVRAMRVVLQALEGAQAVSPVSQDAQPEQA